MFKRGTRAQALSGGGGRCGWEEGKGEGRGGRSETFNVSVLHAAGQTELGSKKKAAEKAATPASG